MSKVAKLSGERLAQYINDAVKDALGPERAEIRNHENEIQRRYGVGEVKRQRAAANGATTEQFDPYQDNPFVARSQGTPNAVPNRNQAGYSFQPKSYWAMEDKDVDEMDANERSLMAARFIGFLFRAQGNPMVAAEMAHRTGHVLTAKALAASILSVSML